MNVFSTIINTCFIILLLISQATEGFAQEQEKSLTEPPVIQPGKKSKAPSDAIVLFDQGNLNKFESIVEGATVSSLDGTEAQWKVSGRKFTVIPGTPNIQTKEMFGDCQLHIEWKTPRKDVKAGKKGQECGNSGIYLMGKYELQVLNSFENTTNYDQQAGAVYRQHVPLVNASLAPGKWQVYDIIFTAPRFNPDGSKSSAGYFTVFHNGVLIQNHVEIKALRGQVMRKLKSQTLSCH